MILTSTLAAPIMLAMATTCPNPPETIITVRPVSERPKVNNKKSKYELEDFDISTVSPYSHNHLTQVNGLMRGKAEIETNVSVSWRTNQSTGKGCFWYQEIDVAIKLAPTIYVASEIEPQSCMYDQVLKHEFEHVNIDRKLSNKYAKIFEQNLYNFVRQNVKQTPQPAYQSTQIKDEMVDALDREITRLNDQMQKERLTRQAQIDTLHEYEKVSKACQGKR